MGEIITVIADEIVSGGAESGTNGVQVLVEHVGGDVSLSYVEDAHWMHAVASAELADRKHLNAPTEEILAIVNDNAYIISKG